MGDRRAPRASAGVEPDADAALRIYLNDQLALGVLWREVARRAVRNNRGTEAGEAVARVAAAIAEDVVTFANLIDRLGIPKSRAKPLAAAVLERVRRLKPNGSFTDYTALARFEELDFLAYGIDGKKTLWLTLRDHAGLAERLPDVDFDHLIERAQAQRDEIEPHRARAARQAFMAP